MTNRELPGRQRGGRRAARGVRRRRDRGAWSVRRLRQRRHRWLQARLYADAPGLVLRCPGCDAVLLRLVSGGGRRWLDVRGLAYLQFSDD